MKDFLKNSLFNCLLPWAFICFQYNQCHGYFAESYEVLLAFLGLIWFINIFLSFIKLPTNFIVSLWVVLILPNLSGSLIKDIIYKIFFVLGCTSIIKKSSTNPIKILLSIIIGFNLFQIVQRDYCARKTANKLIKNVPINKDFSCDRNIYWIVCDAYTSLDVLKDYYHFDNTKFHQDLNDLGFLTLDGQVPYKKVSQFPTLKALNFYTNFNHFDVTKESSLTLHYGLKYNILFNTLVAKGYSLWATYSRFPFLSKLQNVNLLGNKGVSVALQFFYHCFKHNKFLAKIVSKKLNEQLYIHQEEVFKLLRYNFKTNDKCFYYIHVDSPHAPFVRGQNNDFVNDQKSVVWGENEVGTNAYKFKDYRKGYIKQLQGLNKKVLELIKLICQKDPHGIIILQGDHGTFTTDDLREHQSFLFAIKTNIAYKCLQTEQFFKQFIYE